MKIEAKYTKYENRRSIGYRYRAGSWFLRFWKGGNSYQTTYGIGVFGLQMWLSIRE